MVRAVVPKGPNKTSNTIKMWQILICSAIIEIKGGWSMHKAQTQRMRHDSVFCSKVCRRGQQFNKLLLYIINTKPQQSKYIVVHWFDDVHNSLAFKVFFFFCLFCCIQSCSIYSGVSQIINALTAPYCWSMPLVLNWSNMVFISVYHARFISSFYIDRHFKMFPLAHTPNALPRTLNAISTWIQLCQFVWCVRKQKSSHFKLQTYDFRFQ